MDIVATITVMMDVSVTLDVININIYTFSNSAVFFFPFCFASVVHLRSMFFFSLPYFWDYKPLIYLS